MLAFWGFKLHRSGLELGAEGEALTSAWEGFGGLTSGVGREQKFRVFKENYLKNVSMTNVSVPYTVSVGVVTVGRVPWKSGASVQVNGSRPEA